MIVEYHRPESLTKALELLSRPEPLTVPLGGGTILSQKRTLDFAVVDLQKLNLNSIEREGQLVLAGATVTLQNLLDYEDLPEGLRDNLCESIHLEATLNMRQAATLAGVLVSCDGRSPLITALLALDTRLVWAPGKEQQSLGDYLPLRAPFGKNGLLINIKILLNPHLRFSYVSRTSADRPIVCVAVASWPSGRTRVALGGYGNAPVLAMDGPESGGAAVAAREAYRYAGDDWASAAYRMDVAGKLVQRLIEKSGTDAASH